jgi:hypothetical protein
MSDEQFVLEDARGGGGAGEKKEFDPIPDGTMVEAELVSAEKRLHKFFKDDDGNPQPIVTFGFRVTQSGPYHNRRVWGDTPTTFNSHENCKLRQWVEGLLGENDLEPGFTFKLSDLIGSHARISIEYQEWDSKREPGKRDWKNFVADVFPSRGA